MTSMIFGDVGTGSVPVTLPGAGGGGGTAGVVVADARRPGVANASRVKARANLRTDCFFMGNLLRSAYRRCAETRNFFLAIRSIYFARDVYEKPTILSRNLLVFARLNEPRSC